MSQVLIISEFLHKSGAPTGSLVTLLCAALRESNIKETTMTGIGRYSPGGLRPIRIFNLLFINILTPFCFLKLRFQTILDQENRCVVVTSSPPLVHWVAAICGYLFKIPVIYWLFDAHPEIEARIFESKNMAFGAKILRKLDRFFSGFLDSVVTLDEAMKELFVENTKFSNPVLIQAPVATYLKPAVPMRKISFKSKVKFLYAGNYGAAHDLQPMASWLSAKTKLGLDFEITFVGMSDAGTKNLKKEFVEHEAKLTFLDRFDDVEDLAEEMENSSFGIVSLKSSAAGLVCPSKALTYLSQGLPIFYVGPKHSLPWSLCQQGWGITLSFFDSGLEFSCSKIRFNSVFPDPKDSFKFEMTKFISSRLNQ